MLTSDFDYYLPPELIAQTPIEPRDAARMLVLHRESGRLEHRHFREIGEYLRPGDVAAFQPDARHPGPVARPQGERRARSRSSGVLTLTKEHRSGSKGRISASST